MLSDEQQSNINTKRKLAKKRNINSVLLIRKQISHHVDLIWVKRHENKHMCIIAHTIIAKSLIIIYLLSSRQNSNVNFFLIFYLGRKIMAL